MATPNKARKFSGEMGRIRQFSPHYFEFFVYISTDSGSNKVISALFGVTTVLEGQLTG